MKIIFGVDLTEIDSEYDIDESYCMVFCPYCFHGNNNVVFNDYVDMPMIWCDGCDARCVLNMSLDVNKTEMTKLEKIGNLTELLDKHPELKYNIDNNLNSTKYHKDYPENLNEYEFYYVELLFIEKVINSKLSHYNVDNILDDITIRNFIDSNYDKNLMEKYNITKVKEIHYDKLNYNLSLECNSYSATKPVNSYPKNFNMNHDGPSIFLKCKDSNNNIIYTSYCGD